MSTINEVVQRSLTDAGYGGYSQYARPVVTALVDREHQIAGQIIEYARTQGLDEEDARAALAEVGMEVPPEPGEAEATEDPSDLGGVLGRIEEALSGLTQFAREHGYRG